MTKKELRETAARIRDQYASYRAGKLAEQLILHDVAEEDIAYIMSGGKEIGVTPYDKAQAWLGQAMNRLEERVPREKAESIRRANACCLGGIREKRAKEICKSYPTVEERFQALARERIIIGGKAWTKDGDYYISYWYDQPADGYTCGCLRYVPDTEPMNKLWCECCAGYIQHHFETALGVKASSHCVTSALSSCGKEACLFRLHIEDDSHV